MKNKDILLLKTLLRSTSSINIYRTTKDKKQKGKIIGGFIGMALLYLMLIGYCVLMAVGSAYFGLQQSLPDMTAVMISLLSFVFTLLKAGSYLFGFREYEMLMALPFSEKTIVGGKFMYMYMKNLPWNVSISIAMLIGYGLTASPAWYAYPLWIVLTFFLPVIPMLAACFISFLIARIGTMFKRWKIVQTILTFAFILLAISLRFFIEKVARDDKIEETFTAFTDSMERTGRIYLPVGWFKGAVTGHVIPDALLLIITTVLLYEIVFTIFSRSYKKINSAMKTVVASHRVKIEDGKRRSAIQTMAIKELKRFTGSTNYLVNVGFGYIIALIIGVASLFIGTDRLLEMVVQDAPLTVNMILPAIPFVVYFMTGMVPMTTCSPSLEGKNYWIIDSSPLTGAEIYGGKILASLYVSVPAQLISTVLLCISAKASIAETLGFVLVGTVLCLFSSIYGCACGLHFLKLEWENEIEVIKQGTAVVVYMFPNMILTMAVLVGSVVLSMQMGTAVVVVATAGLYAILTIIFGLRIKRMLKAR